MSLADLLPGSALFEVWNKFRRADLKDRNSDFMDNLRRERELAFCVDLAKMSIYSGFGLFAYAAYHLFTDGLTYSP